MTPSLMIFDNFYSNPYDVRNYALSLPFNITGNFPGARTKALDGQNSENAKKMFESILNKRIVYWPDHYNTAFQYTTKDSKTWIHFDPTNWAAVLYLTPDAPVESGTAIYRHIETSVFMLDRNDPNTDLNSNQQVNDESKWEKIIQVGNVFNRLVMYRGEYYHRSMLPGFGDNQFNGRLFQTFFFNIEA